MNFLSDVITYMRRIIKTCSSDEISDDLIIDYINRFWIMDVDAEMQLYDLKTKYQFQTVPGVDTYNMPLYSMQTEQTNQQIGMYPVYQGFMAPAYINGVEVQFETQRHVFFRNWQNITQNLQIVGIGNGSVGPYTLSLPILANVPNPPNPPLQGVLRGHIDIAGIISTGVNIDPPLVTSVQIINNDPFIQNIPVTSVIPQVYFTSIGSDGSSVVISDSGQFLFGAVNNGLLMQPGPAPYGNLPLIGGPAPNYSTTQNTFNYFTGVAQNVYFPVAIPQGQNINAQCYYFNTGLPRSILYYNNVITMRTPPATQFLVEMDAYLSPAAFMTSGAALQFAYMAEYIARGAARKILADTLDQDQFEFYEQFYQEQKALVWKRSQRQFTANRTQTIYSQGMHGMYGNIGNYSGTNL